MDADSEHLHLRIPVHENHDSTADLVDPKPATDPTFLPSPILARAVLIPVLQHDHQVLQLAIVELLRPQGCGAPVLHPRILALR